MTDGDGSLDESQLGEFGRIARLFAPLAAGFPGAFGLTDDAALIRPDQIGQGLVITTDALVAGIHFIGDEPAGLIARKALRVNLSDLAAMGAVPLAYSLALALPAGLADGWVADFADGLALDQAEFSVSLIGGDSVRTPGPISLAITAYGRLETPPLRRNGARPGDLVCLSGTVGDGVLGLDVVQGRRRASAAATAALIDRYRLPRPRLALGRALAGLASAALDVSDGLLADLGHIARASGVAMQLEAAALPLSDAARTVIADDPEGLPALLNGGDDYELAFTVPPDHLDMVLSKARACATPVAVIGRASLPAAGEVGRIQVADRDGRPLMVERPGWRHF